MFGLFESSRTLGEPVTLLFVRYGSGANDYLAFTDMEGGLTIGSVTYDFVAFKADKVVSSGTLDKSTYEVRTPKNNPLVELFRTYPPNEVVTLTVSQGHRDDPTREFITNWRGRILSFGFEKSEAKFTCEPVGTSMRRPGLRRAYTYGCQRVLYGPKCRASKAAATYTTTVTEVSGSIVKLAAGWYGPRPPNKFEGGTLEWTTPAGSNVIRTILQIMGDGGLLLSGLPTNLAVDSTVKAVLGCNHKSGVANQSDGDCKPLHNNIVNFGGCMWIPLTNPIGNRNNFY